MMNNGLTSTETDTDVKRTLGAALSEEWIDDPMQINSKQKRIRERRQRYRRHDED